MYSGNYKDDKRVGIWKWFYENGNPQIIADYDKNAWIHYDEQGKQISSDQKMEYISILGNKQIAFRIFDDENALSYDKEKLLNIDNIILNALEKCDSLSALENPDKRKVDPTIDFDIDKSFTISYYNINDLMDVVLKGKWEMQKDILTLNFIKDSDSNKPIKTITFKIVGTKYFDKNYNIDLVQLHLKQIKNN